MRVGFVGLGFLGSSLARSIVDGGFETVLYDADGEAMRPFTATNAAHASSVGEVAQASDIVGVCVVGDAQVEDVVAGPHGLLKGPMRPGTVIVVHSASKPSTCQRLQESAAAADVALIDAPIASHRDRASTVVVVGGDAATFARCLPVFETFADRERVLHLGQVGSGQVVKLLNNFLLVANMGTAAAALDLGERLGVPRAVMESTLMDGSGSSQGIRSLVTPRAGTENLLGLMTLDVAAAIAMAASAGLDASVIARWTELGLAALRARVP